VAAFDSESGSALLYLKQLPAKLAKNESISIYDRVRISAGKSYFQACLLEGITRWNNLRRIDFCLWHPAATQLGSPEFFCHDYDLLQTHHALEGTANPFLIRPYTGERIGLDYLFD
jgi:hypothetical protein